MNLRIAEPARILAPCIALFVTALWVSSAQAAEPEAREGEEVVFTVSTKTLFPGLRGGGYYRFSWRTIDQSAKANDEDFEYAYGELEFNPWVRSHRIVVKTKRDCLAERDEYFALQVFKRLEARVRFRDGVWGHWYEPITDLPEKKDIRARIIDFPC